MSYDDLDPEFELTYAEELKQRQRGTFRAAKFKIEYDADVLELDVTYAFKNEVIIVLRERLASK